MVGAIQQELEQTHVANLSQPWIKDREDQIPHMDEYVGHGVSWHLRRKPCSSCMVGQMDSGRDGERHEQGSGQGEGN